MDKQTVVPSFHGIPLSNTQKLTTETNNKVADFQNQYLSEGSQTYLVQVSIYMALWKRQNSKDREQIDPHSWSPPQPIHTRGQPPFASNHLPTPPSAPPQWEKDRPFLPWFLCPGSHPLLPPQKPCPHHGLREHRHPLCRPIK